MDGSALKTIRMRDVIIQIKDNSLGIDRKTSKKLYLYGTSPNLARNENEKNKLKMIRECLKKDFDSNIWSIE